MSEGRSERRAHARFHRTFVLEGTPDEGTTERMTANNLSLGGVYCRSSVAFDEMTRLAVRLMLPQRPSGKESPLDLEAVVVRSTVLPEKGRDKLYELALLFTRMSDRSRGRLVRYLST